MGKIIVRVDAGQHLGLGHLARCRVLAQELKNRGHEIYLYGPDADYLKDADSSLFTYIFSRPWQEDEADFLAEVCHANDAMLIIDDFRARPQLFQQALSRHNLTWLQFVSVQCEAVKATLALDYTPGRKPQDYGSGIIDGNCHCLFGEDYLLLRSEFSGHPPRDIGPVIDHVTLAFGGGDDRGALDFAYGVIRKNLTTARVRIIVGHNHPHKTVVENLTRENRDASVLVDPSNIADLLLETDLFITAGGTMSLEACALGTPTVLINIAENQYANAMALHRRSAAVNLGPLAEADEQALVTCLNRLKDPAQRRQLSRNARGVVNGQGARKVADAVEHVMQEDSRLTP